MSCFGNRLFQAISLLLVGIVPLPALGQRVPDGDVVFADSGSAAGNSLRQTTIAGTFDPYTQQTAPTDILSSGTSSDGYNTLSEDPVYRDSFQQASPDGPAVVNTIPEQDGNRRVRAADQVGIIGPDGAVVTRVNSPVRAVDGVRRNPETDPYAAIGFRLGTFTLFPELTQSFGTTSNADFAALGQASEYSQTDFNLQAISDWGVHELRGNVGGSYQTFFNETSDDLPVLDADIQLRLDHSYDITTRLGLSYELVSESALSDNLSLPPPLFVVDRPNVDRLAGFADIEKQAGRFSAALRGTVTKTRYEDATVSDGSILSQSDRDNTLYALRGRLGYETSRALQPFIQASVGMREHEEQIDRNGNARDSQVYAIQAGLNFDRGEKLNGEIAIGYSSEEFEDAALNDLAGFTVDGVVNWSPHRGTTFSAIAQTAFSPSTIVDEAGSVTYAGILQVEREVRPNLSLNARVLASIRDYDQSLREDRLLQGQIGAEWRLNRTASLVASIGHESQESTDLFSNYDSTSAQIGLKLQR